MSLKINPLVESAKALYSRLSLWQRIGIFIAVGVVVFVFLGTIGVKQSPPRTEVRAFKPYRPVARREIPGLGGEAKEGEFPRPPGPGVEVSILEEVRSLKGQIEDLRLAVSSASESAEQSANNEVLAAIAEVREDLQGVSSELKAVSKRLKTDRQAVKEESPIELLGVVSASGFNYAILRTEAGNTRVTEGDRVGPWMVVKIETEEVTLEGSSQSRILKLK